MYGGGLLTLALENEKSFFFSLWAICQETSEKFQSVNLYVFFLFMSIMNYVSILIFVYSLLSFIGFSIYFDEIFQPAIQVFFTQNTPTISI